jgi:serine/threonine-protein kinase HipA
MATHLKNVSVLTGEDGVVRLTPGYDLVCTRLVIPNDPLALSVVGKHDRLHRADWVEFANYCGLPKKAAMRVLDEMADAAEPGIALIARSFLPAEQTKEFSTLLGERAKSLAQ